MTLEKFRSLINGGEKPTVDFKISCNAFNKSAGDHLKAKAELVKDICAMANNGAVASYLIIGVSDDAKSAQSVTDPQLTEQNIQSLVRDAIHPRPGLHVQKARWHNAPHPFKGVDFLIIQIGPNAKHAYRFAQDRIDWSAKFHFRKNEVWVRNGSTSDLATPEQISLLLSRMPNLFHHQTPVAETTSYLKLERSHRIKALSKDARELFEELGAAVDQVDANQNGSSPEFSFRIALPIQRRSFIFRCCFFDDVPKDRIESYASRLWALEHGLIFFTLGSVYPLSKSCAVKVGLDEAWGGFALIDSRWFGARRIPGDLFFRDRYDWPATFRTASIPVIALAKITDTRRLRNAVTAFLEEVQSDEVLLKYVENARLQLNRKIRAAMRPGWNPKGDADFNPHAILKLKRSLRAVSRLANLSQSKRRIKTSEHA